LSGVIEKSCVVHPGEIDDVGVVEFTAPEATKAVCMKLQVEVICTPVSDEKQLAQLSFEENASENLIIDNEWSLWFYPNDQLSTDVNEIDNVIDMHIDDGNVSDLIDNTYTDAEVTDISGEGNIDDFRSASGESNTVALRSAIAVYDPVNIFERSLPYQYLTNDMLYFEPLDRYSAIIATGWSKRLQDYVSEGGRLLYIQTGDGYFTTEQIPFWREAIHIMEEEALPEGCMDDGYCGLQWYSVGTDAAFVSTAFTEKFGDDIRINPILHRLDARKYVHHYYIAEVQLGRGIITAVSLRFQGGLGDQAKGYDQNIYGQYLLNHMIKRLTDKR